MLNYLSIEESLFLQGINDEFKRNDFLRTFIYYYILQKYQIIQKQMRRIITQIVTVIFLTFFLFTLQTNCKTIHRVIPLKQLTQAPRTVFIARLGISSSGATIVVRYGLKGQTSSSFGSLRAGIIHAQQYNDHKSATTCEQKEQLYHQSYEMKFFDNTQGMTTINVGKGKQEHLSFLYVYSCDYLPKVGNSPQITIDILFNNKGNSLKEYGFLFVPYFLLIACAFGAVFKYKGTVLQQIKTKNNIVSLLFTCSFCILLVALTVKSILVVQSIMSGEGSSFFTAVYTSLKVILNLFVSSTLTAIAWGWLLNNPSYKLHFFAILIGSTLVNFGAEIIAQSHAQQISNQHLYQGKMGKLSLLLKLVEAAIFISGCVYVSTKSNEKRQIFINKFTVIGTVFALAHLLSLIISFVFSHNYRHGENMPLIEDIIQFVFCSLLMYLFAFPKEDKGYDTITGLGYDMEQLSMIDREYDEEQQNKRIHSAKVNTNSSSVNKVRYEGKSPDLI